MSATVTQADWVGQEASLFVGQWVAPFLLPGVYNKIIKVAGSDRLSA